LAGGKDRLSEDRVDHSKVKEPSKRVLNVGSGLKSPQSLHRLFQTSEWAEIRFDIDPAAFPDIRGSIADLAQLCPPSSFDAVWASHSIEHLYAHEVDAALSGMHRVLKPDGFVFINCPDIEAIASVIVEKGIEAELYQSPAGPISALDVLFGHSASIAKGNEYMAHKTGFTASRLGSLLVAAGFKTALVKRVRWDLWAVALQDRADQSSILQRLLMSGLDMFSESDARPLA
jgi:SAM-dependent methyltransferase